MRTMLVAPVTRVSGEPIPAGVFLTQIEKCTYIGHEDMAGWKCPGISGQTARSYVAPLHVDGDHVKLETIHVVMDAPVPEGSN